MKRKYLKDLQDMSFCDDDFMTVALNNNIDCVQTMIRILLKDQNINVQFCETQKDMPSFKRGIRMDIYAEDEHEIIYDIEIQNRHPSDLEKRMQFYQASIDSDYLDSGDDFSQLNPSYVIFLLKDDQFSKKIPIHDIITVEDKTYETFHVVSHWILGNLNHEFKDKDSNLYRLYHDLKCTKANKMYFDCFRETMNYYKSTKEGKRKMKKYIDNSFDLGKQEGWNEGNRNADEKYIQWMLNKKFSLEDIADSSQMSIEELKTFIKENNLH